MEDEMCRVCSETRGEEECLEDIDGGKKDKNLWEY
jgi:hypothetical protein